MTTSTKYYVDQFKACIMNYLYSSAPCSLEATYNELKKEIAEQVGRNQEIKYLEVAYELVHEEILGKPSVPSRT